MPPAAPGRSLSAPGVIPGHARTWIWMVAAVSVVVALDQITKQLVVSNIDRGEPVEVIFGVELANVRNKGVAFGLLAGGKLPVLLFTLAALALLLGYFALHPSRPGLLMAVALISGGALGNLTDRVRIGAVIDFIDPPVWPAFNLADVAIVAGVALLILTLAAPGHGDERSPG
jgi:signal peptidase II